jgi:hypothetical protein
MAMRRIFASLCLFSLLIRLLPPPGTSADPVDPAPVDAAGRLLINEILYDAVGTDEGSEFLELLLVGGDVLDLGRVRIERGNGNRAGDWREVWHGAAGDSLLPGEHYLVGGSAVVPAPQATVDLALQNGPDACRLLVGEAVVDVVGWGALAFEEYYAGEPAPDVHAGTSLGRVPDGQTTGNNRVDFLPLVTPSPGAPNRRPSSLRLRSPGHRSDAGSRPLLEIEWAIEDEGESSLSGVVVSACPCSLPDLRATSTEAIVDGAASGALVLGPFDPGPLELCLTATPDPPPLGDEEPAADSVRVAARVGPGPLLVSEFLYRPRPGEPEWLELTNAGAESLLVERFSMADGRLAPVDLRGAPPLAPGELLVVAEEPLPGGSAALVLGSRWPRLNDSGSPVADRIRLLDAEGRTSDDVAYDGDWAPAGTSVERVSIDIASADRAAWSAAPQGATPGRPNGAAREFTPIRDFLQVEPALVSQLAPGPVFLRLAHPLSAGALSVHATDGRLVREFTGGDLIGRQWLQWDGRDGSGNPLAPGLYLISLAGEAADDLGAVTTPESPGAPSSRRSTEEVARATLVVAP